MSNDFPQLVLEHLAVSASAITGVLAAKGKRVDLFGVFVLALVTALGGGTIRDVLVGDLPVPWLRDPAFLINITATTVAVFFIRRLREFPQLLLVVDALALALFAIAGTRKGVLWGFSAPVSVLLGVITGVAGGILRDVLRRELPLVFQPQIHLYATAALIGAVAFVVLRHWPLLFPASSAIAVWIIFLLRLMGIHLKLALPVYEAEEPDPHNPNP